MPFNLMTKLHLRIFFILTVFVVFNRVETSHAQNIITSQNLSTIDVNTLTDDQIQKLILQAQSSGMTENELEQQAMQRGMPPNQIALLKQRISQLSQNKDSKNNQKSNTPQETKRSYIASNQKNDGNSKTLNPKNDSLKNAAYFDKVFDYIRVKVFGEDLFNNNNLTFEPNLRIPTPSNYQLGPDDQLSIDIYGFSETAYKLTVSPEGFIRIPNIGPVFVNGLSIEQARKKVTSELSKIYTGMRGSHPVTFVQITLGDIRSIKVVIVGEVKLPGTYTLPSLATLFNALYSSGGPDKNGSFRNIELIRNGKVIAAVDIYQFLITGEAKQNLRLEDQDVIKINPYLKRVEFRGEVKRPEIFELKTGETLETLLKYAGGFTDLAYAHRIRVLRNNGNEKTVSDVAENEFSTFLPDRGDEFEIGKIINRFSNRVQIQGEVFRPGTYGLEKGLTLKGLLNKADGIKEDAFTNRATLRRLLPDNSPEIISFDINQVLNVPDSDIVLKREDSIFVSSRFNLREKYTVSIAGEVMKSDTVEWASNMHLQDLIIMAGGLTDAASPKRINVIRRVKDSNPLSKLSPIARSFEFDINKDLKSNDSAKDFILEPFDNVFIRTLPGYEIQRYIYLGGEVLYPGTYAITFKNEKISDAINAAGGLTAEAYPEGGTVIRKNLVEKFDRDQQREQLKLISKSTDSTKLAKLINNQQKDISEPVGINLDKIIANPGSKYDLLLLDGDSIKVPQKLETVSVKGQVLYPVKIRFDKQNDLSYYINAAGGFSKRAAKKRTYIIYANGSVKSTTRFFLFNNYPSVKAGSQIFVPDKGEKPPISAAELVGLTSGLASIAVLIFTIFRK